MKDLTGTPRPPEMKTPYDFSPFAQSPLSLDFGGSPSPKSEQNLWERRSMRLKEKDLKRDKSKVPDHRLHGQNGKENTFV